MTLFVWYLKEFSIENQDVKYIFVSVPMKWKNSEKVKFVIFDITVLISFINWIRCCESLEVVKFQVLLTSSGIYHSDEGIKNLINASIIIFFWTFTMKNIRITGKKKIHQPSTFTIPYILNYSIVQFPLNIERCYLSNGNFIFR